MVIVGTSRLIHPTTSCSRRAARPGAGPTVLLRSVVLVLPTRRRARGHLRGGAEDVGPERTGLERGAAAQCPDEGPASLRCVQALRRGVQGGAPAGEPPPRIRDE